MTKIRNKNTKLVGTIQQRPVVITARSFSTIAVVMSISQDNNESTKVQNPRRKLLDAEPDLAVMPRTRAQVIIVRQSTALTSNRELTLSINYTQVIWPLDLRSVSPSSLA